MNYVRTLIVAVVGLLPACGGEPVAGGAARRPKIGFLTNCTASFWVIGKKGVEAAARDFDVDAVVRMPPNGLVEEQKRYLEELLTMGVDGLAVSVIDAANEAGMIDDACRRVPLITHDSDAPESRRLAYIGMDNYLAGREVGKLVKEALPDGGEIMLFIGILEQDNARKRRQGVIDEVLGRDVDPKRFDKPGEVQRNDKHVFLDTRTDGSDKARAKANAEDSIARHPELDCMVGLFAYNPPACLAALKDAGKLGRIKLVAFDEADDTLQGILDGHVFGTVVQDPYRYGYESVRMLGAIARGDRSLLPESGFLDIPARVIRKDNVETFWAELERLTQ